MIIERYAQVPTELMETPIPVGIPYSTIDDRQKTLREFVFEYLTWDLDDGTTVFRLMCMQDDCGRLFRGTDEKDMIDWNGFMSAYGYGEKVWMERGDAMALLPKPEWA